MFKNILGGGSSKKDNSNQSKSKDSRSRQSNDSSSSSTTTSQGFMCPMCYESFSNPDLLQVHFNSIHNDTDSINSNSFNGQHNESFNSKASNMDERNSRDDLLNEVNMWREQTSLLEETRNNLAIELEQLKKDKNNVEIKNNELSSENKALQDNLIQIQEEFIKSNQSAKSLEDELSKRPSYDDFDALKNELNQMQLRMDALLNETNNEAHNLREELAKKEEYIKNLSEKLSILDVFEKLKIDYDNQIKENEEKQKNLEQKTKNIDHLNNEIEEIQKKLSETRQLLEHEKLQNSENNKAVEESNKELKLQINQLIEEKQKLNSSNELLNLKIKNDSDKINELNEAILKLQKEKNDYLEIIKSPNSENEESTNEIDNLKKIFEREKTNLENEINEYKTKYDKLLDQNNALVVDKRDADFKIENLQKLLNERQQSLDKLEAVRNSLATDKQSLEDINKELNESLLKLNKEINSIQDKYRLEQLKNEEAKNNFELEISKLNKEIHTKTGEFENLQKILKDKQQELSKLETENSNLISDKQIVQVQVENLNNSLSSVTKDFGLLQEEYQLERTNNKKNNEKHEIVKEELIKQLEAKTQDIKDLNFRINELQDGNERNTQELEDFKKKIDQLEFNLEDSNNIRKQQAENLSKLSQELLSKDQLVEAHKKNNSSLEESILILKEDIQQKITTIDELSKKISTLNDQNEILIKKMENHEHSQQEIKSYYENSIQEYKNKLNELNINLNDLSNQKETIFNENLKLQSERTQFIEQIKISDLSIKQLKELNDSFKIQINELTAKNDDFKKTSMEYTEKIEKYQKELQIDHEKRLSLEEQLESNSQTIATLRNKLELLVKNLEESDFAKLELIKKHEIQLKVLNQNLANLRNELKSVNIQVQSKESEINEIKGQKLELEAKLSNSIEDRKILLDRCIASENMSENLKAQNIDLKRKCEDLLAGIHELGREHQTLQLQNYKQSTYKWVEDSEVSKCTSCTKQFSVTFRKHHCRNCGQVFCHECSSQQASVGSNKKPQRVCKVCFINLQ